MLKYSFVNIFIYYIKISSIWINQVQNYNRYFKTRYILRPKYCKCIKKYILMIYTKGFKFLSLFNFVLFILDIGRLFEKKTIKYV